MSLICAFVDSFVTSLSANLDRVVQKRAVDFFEPVRRVIRHDDHVALRQLPHVAAFDTRTANLVGRDLLWLDRSAAGNKRRITFDHVNDVSVERVNFGLSRVSHGGWYGPCNCD